MSDFIQLPSNGSILSLIGARLISKKDQGFDRANVGRAILITYSDGKEIQIYYGGDDQYHGYETGNQKKRDSDYQHIVDILFAKAESK